MIRTLHRWPGLVAAILLGIIALSGAALSIYPAMEAMQAPDASGISVAELAGRVQAAQPTVEQIRRAPSGKITAYFYEGDQPAAAIIDPQTGTSIGAADIPALQRWLTNLHRSLFLDDAGRIAVASGAAAMLTLSLSGLFLLARRAGSWRHLFSPLRGQGQGRRHAAIARLSVWGLTLSSATALWMAATTFGFVPEGAGAPAFPAVVSGEVGFAAADIATLQQTPVNGLRSLTFPVAGDKADVFTLKTATGEGYIDQGTGTLLAWNDADIWQRAGDIIMMLHTGQGAAMLGLLLGLSALGVPLMGWSGVRLWLAGRTGRKRARISASEADTIILVGSEGGSTWGFADTLETALTATGARVHTAAMATFAPVQWKKARHVILLAATYGEGEAPASAGDFLDRLAALPVAPAAKVAILGFGDRSFPAFCGYAQEVGRAVEAKGWKSLLPLDTVDRQSPQDFARWGRALSAALGTTFELNHQPARPRTQALVLASRRDYGAEVQAPTSILRFALPKASLWQRIMGRAFPAFEAGDLLGIVPEGSAVPRFYSLASGRRDGFVEICVRKQPGGLCSTQLTLMEPGDRIDVFVRPNPAFRPQRGKAPVLLIGAGTGIGPLAGFARNNARSRPMHLFFGARHPSSDALYAEELAAWQKDGRLASVTTAYSRGSERLYVQDALRRDADRVARLLRDGAQVMVCGGRDMAAGVAQSITEILAGKGMSLATLKAEGRYAEDVY